MSCKVNKEITAQAADSMYEIKVTCKQATNAVTYHLIWIQYENPTLETW